MEFCSWLNINTHDASMLYFYIGLTSSIARVSTGQLCDSPRINNTNVLLAGAIILGVAVILLPMLSTYTSLVVFSIVCGFGDGMITVSLGIEVLMSVTKRQRSFALGVFMTTCAVPMAIGPPFVGFLIDKFGSFSPGFYMSGILIIISGLSTLLIPAATPHEPEHPDSRSSSTVETYIEETVVMEIMTVV